jgi:dTMP kinase
MDDILAHQGYPVRSRGQLLEQTNQARGSARQPLSAILPAMDETIEWINHLRGRFIVFDGPDGSGKTTQFRRLAQMAQTAGLKVIEVREPGGTAIGERIRDILLNPDHDMVLRCEMLLYMASRAQLVDERIAPARADGALVLADRFISSTLAYQGTAGGLDPAEIRQVGRIALRDHWPDLTVIFDVDEQTAASRLNPLLDRMEQKGAAYHRRVRQGFLDQAAHDPEHYLTVDATAEADHVFDQLQTGLRRRFEPSA